MQEKIEKILETAQNNAKELFAAIEANALFNQEKVLNAFRNHRVSPRHFAPTTGYGYDDIGRDNLGAVFAEVFGAESAIASPNIVSGTHALTVALFGLLHTGDRILCVSGSPYDTLQKVICGENIGSLKDYGVSYDEVSLKNDTFDFDTISAKIAEKQPKVIMITRSRGYSWRDAFSIDDIANAIITIRKILPNVIVMVDNCYGEFVEKMEPTQVGADVIVGSLIKNAGGGIAPTGGYIAGKAELIEQIGYRLTSPSIGLEVGSYYQSYMPFYQGLFLAPTVVASALKGTVLASYAFSGLGYEVKPEPKVLPKDIICSVKLPSKEALVKLIQAVQYASPVDSNVTPEPWAMPGYEHEVIMAAGTFVQGASIELSADAPIKEPYIAYLQGGLTYEHFRIALKEILKSIL